MTMETIDSKYRTYRDRDLDTNCCAQCVCDHLLGMLETEPDAVRHVLGSVEFRRLEAYRSYKEQREAAFTEWFHEISTVEKPFG